MTSDRGMQSVSEVVDRLTKAGYAEQFRAQAGGLFALGEGTLHAPENLVVEETERFEGTTDPGDEAIVFGLRCVEHGTRGTYTLTYGPNVDPLDAEMMGRLERS